MGAPGGPDHAALVLDRLAVTEVVLRYFELVDAKAWDRMDEALTEDTTARWTAERLMEGRDNVIDALQHMVGTDEVQTFHHVAAMAPTISGDTAQVTVRARAMHYGAGPRAGKWYESLATQPTELVRTTDGWRIKHHEWQIKAKFGDLEDLFAPELAAGRRH